MSSRTYVALERRIGHTLSQSRQPLACGNRENDRGVVHRMPTPLSNRLVHLEIRVDAKDWCAWAAANGIAPEVLFFIVWEASHRTKYDRTYVIRGFYIFLFYFNGLITDYFQ